MARMVPDTTFYPSPSMAMKAPPEAIAYVAMLNPDGGPDAFTAIDVNASSKSYGQQISRTKCPKLATSCNHFGWNACRLVPLPLLAARAHGTPVLIVPGLRSSRIQHLRYQSRPRHPAARQVIEPEEVDARTGYSRPHTTHCGPTAST